LLIIRFEGTFQQIITITTMLFNYQKGHNEQNSSVRSWWLDRFPVLAFGWKEIQRRDAQLPAIHLYQKFSIHDRYRDGAAGALREFDGFGNFGTPPPVV
jgi:hypothetical protein